MDTEAIKAFGVFSFLTAADLLEDARIELEEAQEADRVDAEWEAMCDVDHGDSHDFDNLDGPDYGPEQWSPEY